MSLLPEDAGYLEYVQAYFLAFRGDGVSLSPLDAELLGGWQAQGIPYEVVCRGIRKAAETLLRDAPQGARLRTLRSCRATVEREFRRYQGLSAGRTVAAEAAAKPPEDFARQRLTKARAQLRKALPSAAEPECRALASALAVLDAEPEGPAQVSQLIARADDTLALVYARGLPLEQRRALVADARRAAGPRPPGASPRARRDALRAHLVARVRMVAELVSLS